MFNRSDLADIRKDLAEIKRLLHHVLRKEQHLMASVDDILTAVAELPTINDSLDHLFSELHALIEQGQTDPAKLQQALDMINAQKERTKAAILANTPAAPEPPPTP